MQKILVTGAGGFIGGDLVSNLLDQAFDVRAVDIKPLDKWYQNHPQAEKLPARCAVKRSTKNSRISIKPTASWAVEPLRFGTICAGPWRFWSIGWVEII